MLLNQDIEKELISLRKETEAFNTILREACLIFEAGHKTLPPMLAAWWANHKTPHKEHEEVHGYRSDMINK